jgi:nicotinic acid phosphoribosyltransferase
MKVSAVRRGVQWLPVSKQPTTDPSKASKAGRVALWELVHNDFRSICSMTAEEAAIKEGLGYQVRSLLKPVYRNGLLLNPISFDAVRNNSEVNFR